MNCARLAERIEELHPEADAREIARLCLLMSNSVDDLTSLDDDHKLTSTWKQMGMKLQVASDQHAAMTEELESLARSDPQGFSPDQIWVLVRAIKVQSQILQLYVGEPALDV